MESKHLAKLALIVALLPVFANAQPFYGGYGFTDQSGDFLANALTITSASINGGGTDLTISGNTLSFGNFKGNFITGANFFGLGSGLTNAAGHGYQNGTGNLTNIDAGLSASGVSFVTTLPLITSGGFTNNSAPAYITNGVGYTGLQFAVAQIGGVATVASNTINLTATNGAGEVVSGNTGNLLQTNTGGTSHNVGATGETNSGTEYISGTGVNINGLAFNGSGQMSSPTMTGITTMNAWTNSGQTAGVDSSGNLTAASFGNITGHSGTLQINAASSQSIEFNGGTFIDSSGNLNAPVIDGQTTISTITNNKTDGFGVDANSLLTASNIVSASNVSAQTFISSGPASTISKGLTITNSGSPYGLAFHGPTGGLGSFIADTEGGNEKWEVDMNTTSFTINNKNTGNADFTANYSSDAVSVPGTFSAVGITNTGKVVTGTGAAEAPSVLSVGSSPWTYTLGSVGNEFVFIYGTLISSVTLNGVQISGSLSNMTVPMRHGDSMVITYTGSAPNVVWMPQ